MATLNLTADNDVIVPSNDDTTYRGLGGNDTYILVSQKNSASVSIIDTEGSNVIQLPEWSKIKSIVVAKSALKITCDNMTCLLYTSPSPRDRTRSRMPSSA